MHTRYREQLHRWRLAGIDIFVLPVKGSVGCPDGLAWAVPAAKSKTGKLTLHINVYGCPHSSYWLFVLLHEVGHHALRHTISWTSNPHWLVEKQADDFALDLIKEVWPSLLPRCEQASKDHIRPLLQDMIDADIWHHVDEDTARWAGCNLKPKRHEPDPAWWLDEIPF